ncbi:MAG: hypothetical protein KC503_38555, partial [Myxococcales bacterium]|nr:hypothetical protein [Myxococcales bacterium]
MTTSKQRRASFAAIALMAVLAMVLASGCRRRRHYERHQSSDPRRVLTGAEITKLFAGKTVQGDHLKKHYYFRSYYDPNGTFRSYQQGSKTARNGKWRVRGDEICVQWGSDPSELCRQMVAGEGGTYWKVKVKPDGRKINIVMYKTFIQGNKADPAGGGATTAAAAGTAAAGTAAG